MYLCNGVCALPTEQPCLGKIPSFAPPVQTTFPSFVEVENMLDLPLDQAIADMNGDQVPDLVLAINGFEGNQLVAWLYVIRGNADGTYDNKTPLALLEYPGTAQMAGVVDVNHDGILDVVTTATGKEATTVNNRVFLGLGDGTFQTLAPAPVQGVINCPFLADLDGDSNVDLICLIGPSGDPKATRVMRGQGDGTFAALPDAPVALTMGQWRGRLRPKGETRELLVLAGAFKASEVLRMLPSGDLKKTTIQVGDSEGLLADMLGEGQPQLITAEGSLQIYSLDATTLKFTKAASVSANVGQSSRAAVGDMNGDGRPDFVVSGAVGLFVYQQLVDGTFQPTFSLSGFNGLPDVADVNLDGKPDIIVTGTLSVYLNTTE